MRRSDANEGFAVPAACEGTAQYVQSMHFIVVIKTYQLLLNPFMRQVMCTVPDFPNLGCLRVELRAREPRWEMSH